MSGALKKTLGILAILLIGMLLLGAVINIIFPNAMTGVTNAIEDSIYRMTNFSIDLNGDGTGGSADRNKYGGDAGKDVKDELKSGEVEGFSAD